MTRFILLVLLYTLIRCTSIHVRRDNLNATSVEAVVERF